MQLVFEQFEGRFKVGFRYAENKLFSMPSLTEAEAEVWRLLMDTATNSNNLSREDNPAKQLAALKEECQNALEQTARNRKKLYDYENNKQGANPFFIGLYKKLYEMSKSQDKILDTIFDKHKAEIAEYLRVNLFQIK